MTGVYDAYASKLGYENVKLQIEGEIDRELFAEYIEVEPDEEKAAKVLRTIRRELGLEAYDAICQALSQGKQTIGPLQDVVEPLFDPADCVPVTLVVYDVLLALRQEGRLHSEINRLPGAREDLTAPKISFYL